MKYNYTEMKENEHSYDNFDLRMTNEVPAVYVRSKMPEDNGNPYIEALPEARTEDEVFTTYNKQPLFPNEKEVRNMSVNEKLEMVALLRKVRFVLPFHALLEQEFNNVLRVSYRDRIGKESEDPIKITMNDTEDSTHVRLEGNHGAASNAGITLIGYSGCGKSASLEILLSNYPQVIIHKSESFQRFPQIVYLVVVCLANSNFSALYISIGEEIDKALGNLEPVYEQMVKRARTVGEKANVICKLIEMFAIGCIIFDEIQLLDFSGQKESTYESLLTVVNKTKVAIMAVGTEDAYSKMFPNLRMSRRTGAFIEANAYCENKQYFATIVSNLMKFQWMDEKIEPNREIIQALYDVSKGIIAQLVSVYMYMQIHYLRAKKKPIINADYIYRISRQYFPGIQPFLDDMNNHNYEKKREEIMKNGNLELERLIQNAQQEANREKIYQQMKISEEKGLPAIKNNAIQNIMNAISITGEIYNKTRIEQAVDHAIGLKRNVNANEGMITKDAYQWLKTHASDKRSGTKKKAVMDDEHIQIRDELLNN